MNSGAIKILLVEDNPGDARLVKEMLTEGYGEGFHLIHAEQLSQALERLNEAPIDVILLDLSLPDSNGLETMMKVRSASSFPIVVLSGFQDEELALEAVEKGAQDYLVKGQVNSGSLTRSIRYAIERNRQEKVLRVPARQQAAVSEFVEQTLDDKDFYQVMDKSLKLVAKILQVEFCKVLELLPDGKTLVLRAGVGWKENYEGHAPAEGMTDTQAEYTILSKEPVNVEDIRTETRFKASPLFPQHGVVSGISIIIHGGDQPFGVFSAHTTKRRTFTPNDIHFLQAVGNVLATAIERMRAQEHVDYMARHDSLTNLPNRQLFVDRLNQVLAHARRYKRMGAVLYLDLDRFNLINDSLGRDNGNLVLKAVADRLTDSVRDSDSVARGRKGRPSTRGRQERQYGNRSGSF